MPFLSLTRNVLTGCLVVSMALFAGCSDDNSSSSGGGNAGGGNSGGGNDGGGNDGGSVNLSNPAPADMALDISKLPVITTGTTLDASGQTQVASYLVNVPGNGGYGIMPILTVGDQVPLLTGTWPKLAVSENLTFGVAGIPDGMGVQPVAGGYMVWLQHEFNADDHSQFSGTVAASTTVNDAEVGDLSSDNALAGARLSLFLFTEDWECVGGMNAINDATALVGGLTQTVTLDTANATVTQAGNWSFGRFCSGSLAEGGFVDPDTGLNSPVWLAAEESAWIDHGWGWMCFPNGKAWAIEGLGNYTKESVVSARQWRATNNDTTVLFATEDDRNGELYMWVGEQSTDDPNGIRTGDLYVAKLFDGATHIEDGNQMLVGDQVTLRWIHVDSVDIQKDSGTGTWSDVDPDGITLATGEPGALSDWVDSGTSSTGFSELGDNSTNFDRLEDFHENPLVPNQFFFAATEGEAGGVEDTASNPVSPGGRPRANVSVVYSFDLNTSDPAGDTTLTVQYQGGGLVDLSYDDDAQGAFYNGVEITDGSEVAGGMGAGISFDNLVVDSFGKVILQEDASGDLANPVMGAEMRHARIYSFNPISGDTATALFEADPLSLMHVISGDPIAQPGIWETSGVVEVPTMNAHGRSALFLNVQAHDIEDVGALNGRYVEGGQLLLCVPEAYEIPFGIAQREREQRAMTVGHVTGTTQLDGIWDSQKLAAVE